MDLDSTYYSYAVHTLRTYVLTIFLHVSPETWNKPHVWAETEKVLC